MLNKKYQGITKLSTGFGLNNLSKDKDKEDKKVYEKLMSLESNNDKSSKSIDKNYDNVDNHT